MAIDTPSNINMPDAPAGVKSSATEARTHTCTAMSRRAGKGKRTTTRGLHDPASPVVAARLRDEGVPASELHAVAADLWRVLPLMRANGVEVAYLRVHPWVAEILSRYGDKASSLFLTERGKVDAR